MNPIVVIPARMASTRLPGKPLAMIGDRPMILHVLDRARAADIGPVVVAVADAELARIVEAAGGVAVRTDPALPSGSDRVWQALCQVDPQAHHDVVVNLQGDLPGLDPRALAAALRPLTDPGVDIGTLVAPMTDPGESGRESVVKAACAFDGDDAGAVARALYFSRASVPWGQGPLWHHVGIYAYRRQALARFVGLAESALERRERLEQLRALEAGMTIGCCRVATAPFGVDTPDDLQRARQVLAGAR
ncbi:3-deoxy-D-manno-octulosonate cytidylyltransferase [Gluconacetobacter johannae DSM 13595]|uniref:3-deoxy-manno-octulosonate cytidylyltransferase n=1 Tax=Gluconacetobacter johannae TaxID=112140 RepID=A0A7W4P413_9PROT|nr:3-deoxy-manno-octulosonate cytidylyltransferase [Gluconacetobacter johannae]MBB2176429.1 3-deoxy-manno-octulosonate cytidylyltransferase [Gluconacetobacter johannae]GBQ91950.1 3-deoxy-D-manno-octulosonate cytidylyltransferase [Gluconacetobacter johannae DSM 13595]